MTISPNFSNGTENQLWFDGQCDGCSRNRNEPNWCPIQTGIMIGKLSHTQAKNAGFDKEGNYPKKLKCWRQYKKNSNDKFTKDLFSDNVE